jgi:Peptidase inhibitor family I36
MRLRVLFTAVLLLCLTSLPAVAQWQWGRPRPPQAGACFYKDSNFRGDYFCLKLGDRWPSMPRGFNDRISSIRLFGGVEVRIFNDDNFGGFSARINRDMNNLAHFRLRNNPSKSWNDRISSMSVIREHDDWDRAHPDRGGFRPR